MTRGYKNKALTGFSMACVLQVAAGRRPRRITPVQAAGAAPDRNCIPLYELRSGSIRSGFAEGSSLRPGLRFACTGLSKSDAFRRQLAVHKKYFVTLLIIRILDEHNFKTRLFGNFARQGTPVNRKPVQITTKTSSRFHLMNVLTDIRNCFKTVFY
jgi:hypothetical protein